MLSAIGSFTWAGAEEAVTLPSHSTRELNREFQEKLVGKVLMKGAAALFLPAPLRIARVVWHMVPFLRKGLRCLGGRKIKVELLDALSIGISVCRRDFGTAGTVMFLRRSASCWRTGRGRSLWPTWLRACPSMWTGCG